MKYKVIKIILFLGILIEGCLLLYGNYSVEIEEEETVPAISFNNSEIDNYEKSIEDIFSEIESNDLILSSFTIKEDNYYIDLKIKGNKEEIRKQLDAISKLKEYSIDGYDFNIKSNIVDGIVTLRY